jgi:hypothetical protein
MEYSPDVGSNNIDHATTESDRASLKVFTTVELLEKILLELPMVDLVVRIPRVSKVFKATIDGSIHLRRALFLEPTAPSDHEGDIRLNPLLLNPGFVNSLSMSVRPSHRPIEEYHIDILPHQPLRGEGHCIQFEYITLSGSKDLCIYISKSETHFTLGSRIINEGSWKQMFLTQPPIPVIWTLSESDGWILSQRRVDAGARAWDVCNTSTSQKDSPL